MAVTSNIKILTCPEDLLHVISYPKKASEVIAYGDLLEENTGAGASVVDGATGFAFIGVAMRASPAAEVGPIPVMIKGVIQVTMGAGHTATFGQALKYHAGANGTDWNFEAATAEGIVWAMEAISAAGTGRALVDVTKISTGKFQVVT